MPFVAVPIALAAGFSATQPLTAQAAGSTSSSVGYLTDASNGGFSLWTDGFGIVPVANGGSYSTATPAAPLTVTIHNVDMTQLDVANSTALSGLDTLVMYDTCDIANHPNAMVALNSFFNNGGKLIIFDGAQCVDGNGGQADYSSFAKPFTTDYVLPIPQSAPYTAGPYATVEASTLTTALPDCTPSPCNEPGNSVTDASMLSPNSDGWCKALGGTSFNGVPGAIEAYARNGSGSGLVIYSGEPFAYGAGTAAQNKHARLVFDDTLTQPWNTDGLACSHRIKALTLSPKTDSPFTGSNEALTAHVTDGAGNPASGVVVTFTVVAGPNVGTTGSGTSNGSGDATFSYSSSKVGTDVLHATFTDPDHHVSGPAKITWAAAPPPVIAETHAAILVPAIGFLVIAAFMALTAMRRRRRSAAQTR